jgi:hypothetical protein
LNVFIALAPVARLDHTPIEFLKMLVSDLDEVKFVTVDILGMYNFF